MNTLLNFFVLILIIFAPHTSNPMYQTVQEIPRGLPNRNGSSCFMNATLQALATLEGFAPLVNLHKKSNKMLTNISSILDYLTNKNETFKNIDPFHTPDFFNNLQQADPVEFIKQLIASDSNFEASIKNLINIETHSQKFWSVHSHTNVTRTSDHILTCKFPEEKVCALDEYIEELFEDERIDIPCVMRSSPNNIFCIQKRNLIQTTQHLIIAAKTYENQLNEENIAISFPLTLELKNKSYDLSACIFFQETFLTIKHYMALIKKNNSWYLCDDETIREFSISEINEVSLRGNMEINHSSLEEIYVSNFFDNFAYFKPCVWFYTQNNHKNISHNGSSSNRVTLHKNVPDSHESLHKNHLSLFHENNISHSVIPYNKPTITLTIPPIKKRRKQKNKISCNKICCFIGCLYSDPFSSDQALYEHLIQKHCKNRTCSWKGCKKTTFSHNGELKKHLITHTCYKPFSCTYCDYACNNKANLTVHMNKEHKAIQPIKENTNLFDKRCHVKDCSYQEQFLSDKALYEHLINEHSRSKRCLWEGCSNPARNLKKHLLSHTLYKPFACTYCDRAYKRESSLTPHMKKKHSY